MIIVYCGELNDGGTCRMRMEALERLGHRVIGVETDRRVNTIQSLLSRAIRWAGWALDLINANKLLRCAVETYHPALVWVDKGVTIKYETLREIRRLHPPIKLVSYSGDDMGVWSNQSRQYTSAIVDYDLHVTTKAYHVPELYNAGARAVLRLNCAYCRNTHKPASVTPSDRMRMGGNVGFIGTFEVDRAEMIWYLAHNGVPVRVWGGGWVRWAANHSHPNLTVEKRGILGPSYAEAICSFDILLGFLSALSHKDLHTTRSVEIPACGGFLLAERTTEHQQLFREGIEAEFYGDRKELLEKCLYYLAHAEERRKIAAAGRERCSRSDYSYDRHVGAVLEHLSRPAEGWPRAEEGIGNQTTRNT